jgi:aromatic aminotransferase
MAPPAPLPSRRVLATDAPVVAKTKAIIAASGRPDVASLAQGVVHWPPPRAALRTAARLAADAARAAESDAVDGPASSSASASAAAILLHSYGPTPGYPPLRAALRRRMARMGLTGYEPVVTPGANCAFTVALLALCDEGDSVALFPPLYFNHRMAVQMTGGARSLLIAPMRESDLRPDLDWLESVCIPTTNTSSKPPPPKVVVLVNPANPTGVALTRAELDRAADVTRRSGSWLLIDDTYADFTFDGREHYCPAGPNVVHLFSMSKAYGMMGWRVGWIALPPEVEEEEEEQGEAGAGAAEATTAAAATTTTSPRHRHAPGEAEDLGEGGLMLSEILKVQDSIPICATQLSQAVALAALEGDGGAAGGGGDDAHDADLDFGDAFVSRRVADLARANRPVVRAALAAALGEDNVLGGEGGIYFFARLPPAFADRAKRVEGGDDDVVEWLVRQCGVCVLPGSACAAPGWLRVAFANLPATLCEEAAGRLRAGLEELVRRGPAALDDDKGRS